LLPLLRSYELLANTQVAYSMDPTLLQSAGRDRLVGSAQSTNHLLGGMLLHQTRRELALEQVGVGVGGRGQLSGSCVLSAWCWRCAIARLGRACCAGWWAASGSQVQALPRG
jgi:hypothetical protein